MMKEKIREAARKVFEELYGMPKTELRKLLNEREKTDLYYVLEDACIGRRIKASCNQDKNFKISTDHYLIKNNHCIPVARQQKYMTFENNKKVEQENRGDLCPIPLVA